MILQMMTPTERTAEEYFREHFADAVKSVTRFSTGLCHYVYEVVTVSGDAYVVRIANSDTQAELKGGLYWHPRLKAAGVPVPALYAGCIDGPFAYMLLERLPGADLGDVYSDLSSSAKKALAERIVEVQQAVGALPRARRYGFASSYEQIDETGSLSWAEVVRANICGTFFDMLEANHGI